MNKIILSEDSLIGQGHDRECYQHPDDDSLCVKVLRANSSMETKKQLQRELDYNRLLMKRNVLHYVAPLYHGEVDTNKGTGYVFDLIKDFDGKASIDLYTYLRTHDDYAQVSQCLRKLKHDLLKHNVVTMDLFPNNILCQRVSESEIKTVIIDDIGTAVLIKLEYYFSFAAKARVERKWKILKNRIEHNSGVSSPAIGKLLEEI